MPLEWSPLRTTFTHGAIPFVEDVDARGPCFAEQAWILQDLPRFNNRPDICCLWNEFEDDFESNESLPAFAAATGISFNASGGDYVVSDDEPIARAAGV